MRSGDPHEPRAYVAAHRPAYLAHRIHIGVARQRDNHASAGADDDHCVCNLGPKPHAVADWNGHLQQLRRWDAPRGVAQSRGQGLSILVAGNAPGLYQLHNIYQCTRYSSPFTSPSSGCVTCELIGIRQDIYVP